MDHDTTNEQEAIIWSPGVSLEDIEKSIILKAFRFYRGNKTATAQSLGIAIRTLTNKLEGYKENAMRQQEAIKAAEDDEREYALRARGEHPDQLREKFPEQYDGEVYPAEPLDSLGYTPDSDDEDADFAGDDADFGINEDDDFFGADESFEGDAEEPAPVEKAGRGARVQSTPKPSKKSKVSVPKRTKVQAVSSKNASRISLDGGRKGVRSRA